MMPEPEVPASEAVERPWASNDKVQFDWTISHGKRVDIWGESLIKEHADYVVALHDQKLRHEEELHKQKMEHENALFHEKLENNRYTLDRLYSVFAEESASLVNLLKAAAQSLGYDLVEKK